MSVEEKKNIIRKYIEEVINTGNIDEIEEFISPNYTEIHEGKRYPVGIIGAKEHIIGVRQTYPDLKLTVDQQITEHGGAANLLLQLLEIGAIKVVGE
jgi:hypothetical protein